MPGCAARQSGGGPTGPLDRFWRATIRDRSAIRLLGGICVALALATILGGTVLAVISIAIVPHAFVEVSGRVATAMVLGIVAGYLLS